MTGKTRRLSYGGQVVESSLAAARYDTMTPGVSLIESGSPWYRYEVVLLQNAWNVLPQGEFLRLMGQYPGALKRRARARRAIARINLRRAGRVVCLTEAVAAMLRDDMGIDPCVAPVTAPIHDWAEPGSVATSSRSVAVVPGTVTWYKRPVAALNWIEASGLDVEQAIFCGEDDGSGCWQDVLQRSDQMGLPIERTTMPHAELYQLYAAAEVVILPSGLESLGFGLSEALLHAKRVVASPIPPHCEVAARTGGCVEWLSWRGGGARPENPAVSQPITKSRAVGEWTEAGRVLRLRPLREP